PTEQVAPPPPPPPPPQEAVQQSRYVPPVVVDSVKPEEAAQLMTADQAQVEVRDEEVIEFVQEVKEEVKEEEPEAEPFVVVEEMPMFPGGDAALLQFIAEHTQYPEVAKENNIQGKVIVRFCVTSKGTVDRVSVLKGVDPELDKEAMRVVTTLPPFKPGKQGGIPVPVWYMVPINFTLK
ncbi:MAG TPA: energy transducer TonB, partial [Bacteroidales bacterium]|nr:energy transducer TonB [Bacteroidales bacterium]